MKLIIIAVAIGLVVTIIYKKGVFSTLYTSILLHAAIKVFAFTLNTADEDYILSIFDGLLKRYGSDNIENAEIVLYDVIYKVFDPWYEKNQYTLKAEHINNWLLDRGKLLDYHKNKEES